MSRPSAPLEEAVSPERGPLGFGETVLDACSTRLPGGTVSD